MQHFKQKNHLLLQVVIEVLLGYTEGTFTPLLKLLLKNYCCEIILFGPTCYNLRVSVSHIRLSISVLNK